tara:strand:- start:1315 stop:1902 length:588 start_codon:yes stop_codon:yes gene_type:complete
VSNLNPPQKLDQTNQDHNWCDVLDVIEKCYRQHNLQILVREVSEVFGPTATKYPLTAGVKWLEKTSFGGTNCSTIELARHNPHRKREILQPFLTLGKSTCEALSKLSPFEEPLNLIASGGVRHSLDVARYIRFVVKMTALAQPTLSPAIEFSSAVIEEIKIVSEQLTRTMFLTGKHSLEKLKEVNLLSSPRFKQR